MQTYSAAFIARVVLRLMGLRAINANRLAATVGVLQETFSRWLWQARSVDGRTLSKKRRTRSSFTEKLRVVLPGQAHGFGPMQAYFNRALMEYFAEHLLGDYYRHTAEIR